MVDESNVEDLLATRRRVRATRAISEIQRESIRKETAGNKIAEIDSEIKRARKDRRKS